MRVWTVRRSKNCAKGWSLDCTPYDDGSFPPPFWYPTKWAAIHAAEQDDRPFVLEVFYANGNLHYRQAFPRLAPHPPGGRRE